MKSIRICNIERIMLNFKRWLLLNKMVLIKSFLTGALYDRSKCYIHVFVWTEEDFANVIAVLHWW